MGTGPVSTFGQGDLPAGSEIVLRLDGEPSLTGGASSENVFRDNSTELLIGIAVAAGVIVIAVWLIRGWRQEPLQEMSRDELLDELADLDDAFEAGEINEAEYHRERDEIKADLMAIWE
jgi:HAMP domain-containing protein